MEAGTWSVRIAKSPEEIEAIIRLFEQLAQQERWRPGEELRAHQERSQYFALVNTDAETAAGIDTELIGGLQLVSQNTTGGLPSHTVWPELPVAPTDRSVAHAAVLAVIPEGRKRGGNRCDCPDESALFWLLCLSLWRHCVETGVRELWMEATPKMLRAYRLLGLPLVIQGPLRVHWGEPCYPCKLSVREVAGALAERALRSSTYRHLFTRALAPVLAQAA